MGNVLPGKWAFLCPIAAESNSGLDLPPGLDARKASLDDVQASYVLDAYHSLSIEIRGLQRDLAGYRNRPVFIHPYKYTRGHTALCRVYCDKYGNDA